MDARELDKALKSALRLTPPLRGGVPKILFNLFITQTAAWLANGSSPSKLPLFSLRFLERKLAENEAKLPTNKRSASDATRRAKQIADTLSAALTTLTKRLRSSPAAVMTGESAESLVLVVDIALGSELLTVELSGPLQKHRDGLDFVDNHRVGFLARIAGTSSQPAFSVTPAVKRQPSTDADRAPLAANAGMVLFGRTARPVLDVADLAEELAQRLPEPPLRVPRQLPQPPRDFSGRDDELSELLASVSDDKTTIVALQGPDGIGKTALGLALAHQLSGRYSANLFLDLRGTEEPPLTPIQAMQHVLRAYRPRQPLPESADEILGMYHSLLQETPALLFFDNVRDAAQMQPLVPPQQSLLIVTSVGRFAFPGMYCKQVSPLPLPAARELLLRIVPRAHGVAEEIARLCEGFPLLLRAAGSALQEAPNLLPADYAQHLRGSRARLELVDPTSDRSIRAVLDLAYALLPDAIQPLFDALSVFPAPFDENAAAAVWRKSIEATRAALTTLIRRSFLDYRESEKRYEVHQIMKAFGETQLRPSVRKSIESRFARYYRSKLHGSLANDAVALDDAWNNIVAAHQYAESRAGADRSAALLLITFPLHTLTKRDVRWRLSPHDQHRWLQPPSSNIRSRKACQLISRNLADLAFLYGDHEDIEQCLKTLARLTTVLPDLADNGLFNQVLGALFFIGRHSSDLADCIIGYFTPMVRPAQLSFRQALLLNFLGLLHAHYERYEEAEICIHRSVEIIGGLPLYRHAAVRIAAAEARNVILGILADASASRGDVSRAIEYADERLRLVQDMHLSTAGDEWGAIALLYARSGDFARATDAYRKRLELLTDRDIDVGILDEADAWMTLARDGQRAADERASFTERGYELLHCALRISQRTSNGYEQASAQFALGAAYLVDKRHEEAANNLRQAVAGFRGAGNPQAEVRGLMLLSSALLESSAFGTAEYNEGFAAREEALRLLKDRHDPRATKIHESLRKWRLFETQGRHPFLDR